MLERSTWVDGTAGLGAGSVPGTLPFREVVDGDPDHGVVLFDTALRQVYANASARKQVLEAEGAAVASLRTALVTYRDALDRGVPPNGSAEQLFSLSPGRSVRATIAAVRGGVGRWFVIRLVPCAGAPEPDAQRLKSRFHLTPREVEVALDVSKGLSNAEVAGHLGVTEKTVKNVLMQVFEKVRVRNRVELALRAHDAAVGLRQPSANV